MTTTTRTITLTGRPPVTIHSANWPEIASAIEKGWDGEYEFQAARRETAWVRVRKHADGRAIVYSGYAYSSAWRGERDDARKAGVLLPPASSAQQICDAIQRVCEAMPTPRLLREDLWDALANEAIASMPAEELA